MKGTTYITMTATGSYPVYDIGIPHENTHNENLQLLVEFLLEKNGYGKELMLMNKEHLKIFINRELSVDKILNENE